MLDTALRLIGFGLCHQLPERSFFGGAVQVPVCARDTGVYVGFLISILVIVALQRNRPTGLPGLWVSVLLAAMVLSMAIDGISSYAGIRETTNALRLLTGLMAGYAMGAVALPLINGELWASSSDERVLSRWPKTLSWFASLALVFAGIYWLAPFLGVVYPLLVTAFILGTLTAVNLLIVLLIPAFNRKAHRLTDAWLPLLLAFGLTWLEIVLSALVKLALVTFAGPGA